MRYEVRAVANENCNRLRSEIIAATDDLGDAKRQATAFNGLYGAGIEDTQTRQIDFGQGFGVVVEIDEE